MFWSSFCFAETAQKISHTEIPPEACALCGASILTCAAAIDVHPYWFSAQKSNSKAEIFKSAKQLRTTVLLNTKRFRTAPPSRIFEQKPCEWIQRLRITPAFSRFEHRNGELLFPRKTFSKRTFKNFGSAHPHTHSAGRVGKMPRSFESMPYQHPFSTKNSHWNVEDSNL